MPNFPDLNPTKSSAVQRGCPSRDMLGSRLYPFKCLLVIFRGRSILSLKFFEFTIDDRLLATIGHGNDEDHMAFRTKYCAAIVATIMSFDSFLFVPHLPGSPVGKSASKSSTEVSGSNAKEARYSKVPLCLEVSRDFATLTAPFVRRGRFRPIPPTLCYTDP